MGYEDPSGHWRTICDKKAAFLEEKRAKEGLTKKEQKQLDKYYKAQANGNKKNRITSAEEYARRVSDRTEVTGNHSESASASVILREELYAAGICNPPYPNAAHHIIPWNDSRAATAQNIMRSVGIDFNSAANGVFLPMGVNAYTGDAAQHIGRHSSAYIENITTRLQEVVNSGGGKSQVVSELNKIREELLNGTLKLNE